MIKAHLTSILGALLADVQRKTGAVVTNHGVDWNGIKIRWNNPSGWDAILSKVFNAASVADDIAFIYSDIDAKDAGNLNAEIVIVVGCHVRFKSVKATTILCTDAVVEATSVVAKNIYVHGGTFKARLVRAENFVLDEYELIKNDTVLGDPDTGLFARTLPVLTSVSTEKLRTKILNLVKAHTDEKTAKAVESSIDDEIPLTPIDEFSIQMLTNSTESFVVEEISKKYLADDPTNEVPKMTIEEILQYFEDAKGKVVGPDGPALTSGKTPGSQSWLTSVCSDFNGDMPSVTKKEELAFLMTAMPEFHAHVSKRVMLEKGKLQPQAKAKKVEAIAASTK